MLGLYDPWIGDEGMECEKMEVPATGLQATPEPPCLHSGVACYASQLEQDIAALEEEANRWEGMDWESPTGDAFGSCMTAINKALSNDLDNCVCDQAASDLSSDDETDQPEEDMSLRIRANARMVKQAGKPMQQGAWKGCTKSAWCDREDRHRGLCNHRATIPGPASCSLQSDDACSRGQHDAASCGPNSRQQQQQPAAALSSGGHSHNCKSQDVTDGDEREVASALKAGPGIQQDNVPFLCLSQKQQGAAEQQQRQQRCVQQVPDLLWDGSSNSSRAEAAGGQLFALPAFYQPRVKDLEAPDISSMLSAEGLCTVEAETNIEVPVVEPVEMEELDASDTLETSCQTQVCGKPGFSTPSSPSCASAAAKAESGAFAMPVPVAVVLLPGSHVPAALVAVPSGCLPSVRLPGMLPLEEVHPPSTGAQGSASSKPASAQRAAEEGPNAACTEQTLLRRSSSSGSSANQAVEAVAPAAAPAAAAEVAAADTDASPSAAPVASSPRAGAAPAVKAAAAPKAASPKVTAAKPAEAVAEPKLPPPMQRVPRIKHKPRRADDPPRPLLEPSSNNSSSCSPNKVKKRPAGRMAIAPTSGHSCTQCGAVSTPVWRAGPAGPKTLCNACGVRYMKIARRK